MRRVLVSLREALAQRCLTVHPSKCKVQTNTSREIKREDTRISEGFSVEVLYAGVSLSLCGTALSLDDVTKTEIHNRLAAGWRLFWSMEPLLVREAVSVTKRLRLFDATSASCV